MLVLWVDVAARRASFKIDIAVGLNWSRVFLFQRLGLQKLSISIRVLHRIVSIRIAIELLCPRRRALFKTEIAVNVK